MKYKRITTKILDYCKGVKDHAESEDRYKEDYYLAKYIIQMIDCERLQKFKPWDKYKLCFKKKEVDKK